MNAVEIPVGRESVLELSAWRFLALRRCPGLSVAHVEFIDGPKPTIVTPADESGFYESADADTFGDAAIALALQLGMPCTDSDAAPTDFDQGTSSAATAIGGGSESNSPLTPSALADSTIAAIGAALSDETRGAL